MRRAAWWLLLLFAFAVPWEHSLDLGEPVGNIARMVMLVLLPVAVLAVLEARRLRPHGAVQGAALALFVFLACSYAWSIDGAATLERLRAYAQEMIAVWLVWEWADSEDGLRDLLCAYVAGSWVLALLTMADFAAPGSVERIRFAAAGQDPNDVARLLGLGLPLAAYLVCAERDQWRRWMALAYVPVALLGVLLTGSRSGLLTGLIALGGSCVFLARVDWRGLVTVVLGASGAAGAAWMLVPRRTLGRLATIPEQLAGGDLNQRLNIWDAGWNAFRHAPFLGTGAGTFVSAAGLAAEDTAHNTALSLGVEGGVIALVLASILLAMVAREVIRTHGALRVALGVELLVLVTASLGATVEATRSTWLLLGMMAVAGANAAERATADARWDGAAKYSPAAEGGSA